MSDKLQKLKESMAKIQAEIEEEQKRLKEKAAKELQQRIKVVGKYFLDTTKEPDFKKLVVTMEAAGYLKKNSDRKAFGLELTKDGNTEGDQD
ncbi:MAG: hypothetical protein M0036_04730 [Desulfobacteraceae bacterium]|nr:hypothetical protein [Desulfobacteraceae bacterium]